MSDQDSRRSFITRMAAFAVGAPIVGTFAAAACDSAPERASARPDSSSTMENSMAFTLPPLPYANNALEPHIDAQTMEIHHDKHHQGYVTNLNKAIEKAPSIADWSLDDICRRINEVPEDVRTAVRNNAGGHWNHSMFWKVMGPNAGGEPTGAVSDGINKAFGSFSKFKEQFQDAATGRFGSGWAWLVSDNGSLSIMSTPNQDNPLMEGKKAVLGVDVWEHAYYLKYQNKRADYLAAWWNVVNWSEVQKLMQAA